MVEGHAPHGVLILVVVGVVVGVPYFLGQESILADTIAGILSPAALLLLPLILLLIIQFLSSNRAPAIFDLFSGGEPNSIHRVGGSPVGVALLLLVLLFLLYNRVSLFGSGDDDSGN